jgi:hypothetical protein
MQFMFCAFTTPSIFSNAKYADMVCIYGFCDEILMLLSLDYDSRLLTFQAWSLQADKPITEVLRCLVEEL